MTKEELIKGYEQEINYQKHMIENLGRWFTLFLMIAGIGVVLTYFFKSSSLFFLVSGIILIVLGIIGISLFGYGIYKGKKNITKVIDHFELQLSEFN